MKAWLKILALPSASLGLLCALIGSPSAGYAQTAAPAPAPAAPAADAPPQILGFDFTGYVDAGYTDFTTGKGTFQGGGHAYTFNWENGVASIQNVDVRLSKAPDAGFGGMLDLTFGKDADTIKSYGLGVDKEKGPYGSDVSFDPTDPKPSQTYYDVTQLFATYATGPVTILLGKYATHAGQEVITSRDDTNFSRSILFGFAIPFTHTGVRAAYKASDTLNLMLGANEGWDIVTGDNGGTTAEFDWEWSPAKAFSFFGTYLSGQQLVNGYYPSATLKASPKGDRTLVDLLFTYNATDALSFVLNYDNGSQAKVDLSGFGKSTSATATWDGYAVYANYTISDNWRVSGRAESFEDPDNYRVASTSLTKNKGITWTEETATVAYMGIKKVELRAEVRTDSADQKVFSAADSAKAPIDSMTSIGLEAIYKF